MGGVVLKYTEEQVSFSTKIQKKKNFRKQNVHSMKKAGFCHLCSTLNQFRSKVLHHY